jgi:hypothetical protein
MFQGPDSTIQGPRSHKSRIGSYDERIASYDSRIGSHDSETRNLTGYSKQKIQEPASELNGAKLAFFERKNVWRIFYCKIM